MRIADLGDRLLALLDVLDELDRALVALFHVVACALFVGAVAGDQFLVRGIQAKLRQVFVVHDDQPLVAVLDEGNVGLDEACLDLVVAQTGAGIERANVVQRRLHGFDRTPDGLGDLFVLLVLQAAQMLIDDGHGILQNLLRAVAVLVLTPVASGDKRSWHIRHARKSRQATPGGSSWRTTSRASCRSAAVKFGA